MGCDYMQETCLEISWINPDTNLTQVDHYILEDQTEFMYFQSDLLDQNLEINFEPIDIFLDGEFNKDLYCLSFEHINRYLYGSYEFYCWLNKYLLDWLNPYADIENIANGTYITKSEKKKINKIRLIKRNSYLGEYYYKK